LLPTLAPIIVEILTIITRILDFIAVTIIAVSIFQLLVSKVFSWHDFPFPSHKNELGGSRKYNVFKGKLFKGKISLGDLINGLLLALEFESASAIIKLGIFTTSITLLSEPLSSNLGKFAFFVGILTLRIALNQSLRRYKIN